MANPPKPKSKPKPKSAGPQTVDYVYCKNPKCSFHATFLHKSLPADMTAGATCKVCRAVQAGSAPGGPNGTLDVIQLKLSVPVPASSGGPPSGTVLPVPPYGGFRLQFGDDDATSTWQGAAQSEARHSGARYIAELQRDLLRLGFFSHDREFYSVPLGRYVLPAASAILDFKRQLSLHYGVSTVGSIDEAIAKEKDAEPPIYYKTLLNPGRAVLGHAAGAKAVTALSTGFAKWAASWDQGKKTAFAAVNGLATAVGKAAKERQGQTDACAKLGPKQASKGGFTLGPRVAFDSAWAQAKTDATAWIAALQALKTAAGAWETKWQTPDPKGKAIGVPAGWSSFLTTIDAAIASITAWRTTIGGASYGALYDDFRQALREMAIVDAGTARNLRQMVFAGTLRGRAAFLMPMNNEIDTTPLDPLRAKIEQFVDDLKVTVWGTVRTKANTPVALIEAIFANESGAKHVREWGGTKFVILGIDWANSGESRATFLEHAIDPERFSWSRGWGAMQMTLFGAEFEDFDQADKAKRKYDAHGGVPYSKPAEIGRRPQPSLISSVHGNVRAGINLLLAQKTPATAQKRDCTFMNKYACHDCMAHFTPANDFKQVGATFAIASDAKLRSLLKPPPPALPAPAVPPPPGPAHFALPGVSPADADTFKIQASHRAEFPCSWIKAVMLYNGGGSLAFHYGISAMNHAKKATP